MLDLVQRVLFVAIAALWTHSVAWRRGHACAANEWAERDAKRWHAEWEARQSVLRRLGDTAPADIEGTT